MKKDIVIPRMGESISQANIGQIFKNSGSFVNQDDEILELETDKVNQVLFAPSSGVVTLSVKKDDVVAVDQVIGFVDTEAKGNDAKAPETAGSEAAKKEEADKPTSDKLVEKVDLDKKDVERKDPVETVEASSGEKIEISPQSDQQEIRQTKEKYLADLDESEKTKEVANVSVSKESTPSTGSRTKMSRIRQTIAKRLVQAKTETAMLTTFNEVDMTEILALREKYKEAFLKKYGVKMGFMPFFVLAVISALKEFPLLNASIEGDEIVQKDSIDMGVAVSTDRGLVVPVIKNADKLTFDEIETQMANLAKKAREGGLAIEDITGGTFTITNGGAFGSLFSTPILNFPQSGILGMHGIQKRPIVIDNQIFIRSMMYLALSYDHRIVDGKEAVLFIMHIKGLLEEPSRFLIGV